MDRAVLGVQIAQIGFRDGKAAFVVTSRWDMCSINECDVCGKKEKEDTYETPYESERCEGGG